MKGLTNINRESIIYNGENHQEIVIFTNGLVTVNEYLGGDEKGNGHWQLYVELLINDERVRIGDEFIKELNCIR